MSIYQPSHSFLLQYTVPHSRGFAPQIKSLFRFGLVVLLAIMTGCSLLLPSEPSEPAEEISQTPERRGSLKGAISSSISENRQQQRRPSISNQRHQDAYEQSRSRRDPAVVAPTASPRREQKRPFRDILQQPRNNGMRHNTDMGSVDRSGSRTSPLMLSNNATGEVSFDNWIKVDEFGNLITSVIVETLYDIAVVSDDDSSDEMLYADAQDFTQDDASSSHEPATLLPGNEEHQTHVGFDTAFMPVRNGTIDVIREVSLYLEEGTEKSALGIAITRFNYTLTTGTQFQQAVSESSGGGIYFYYKRYLNQRGVFASPYLLGGIGGGNLNWRYRQGIIDSDGYLIDSDSLGFTDLRFGVGSELGRPYSVSLTLSATAIWRIYNATTEEGFDNDVLPDHYVPAFGSSLSIKF